MKTMMDQLEITIGDIQFVRDHSPQKALLKDFGYKYIGFTKMDAAEIRRIKKAAFTPVP